MSDVNTLHLSRRVLLKVASILPFIGWASRPGKAETSVFVDEDESHVRIGNSQLELTFRKETGSIEQVRAVELGLDLRNSSGKGPEMTWELSFYHPETESLTAPSYEAEKAIVQTRDDGDEVGVTITWTNPRLYPNVQEGPRFEGKVTVEVSVRENDPLSYWQIDVENNDSLAIKSIECPKIMDIDAVADDGTDGITLPSEMGRRFVDPTQKFKELGESAGMTYPSGFGTMQFTSYAGPNGGFYSDARDTEGHVKRWRWGQSWEDADRLRFDASYFPPQLPGEDVHVPYTVTFGALDGQWYDAADRYRTWVNSEGWLSDFDGEQPDWLRDLGATYRIETYHPEGTTVEFDRASELVQEMDTFLDLPLQFQFGQWQHGPDDSPVEGWESFTETVDDLASAGIRTNSFVGGNIIGRDNSVFEEKEDATDWVVRDQNGEPDWIGDQEQLYQIESTQEGWQQYIREYIENLLDRGVTEIQYDGFPYVLPECYDPNHNHPPGQGGNWFSSAAREDTRELQELLRKTDDGVLSGEGICDYYVPYLDVFNTRDVFGEYFIQDIDTGWVEIIPLFEYAFGDIVVSRNQNHEGLENEPSITRLFTARALMWGALPVFRYADPEADPEVPGFDNPPESLLHFRRVAQARADYANRFLARGRMLPPPVIDTDEVLLTSHSGVEVNTDAVLGSAWESAEGETGLTFTNVSSGDTPQTLEVDIDFGEQPFSIPEGETLTYVVRNGQYERLDNPSATELLVEVAPDHVVLVVVAPHSREYEEALEAIVDAQEVVEDDHAEDTLISAKRALEARDFTGAIEHAEATQTSSESNENRSETGSNGETSETGSNGETSETSEEIPGFGWVAGAASVVGAVSAKLLNDRYKQE
ncbi:DUF6259 domain-containing protein [Halalkalirubrum salinum]|uniref:DUF6259 domain-containing protein n=1 Tax=Halalkalirubrum salinum TaxID=2563889 RepID=UPI0010FB8FA6|nr:DUF6259 domain-containing protein [Halalkalirubrum salinum]